MILLVLGVLLWIAAHWFRRVLPGPRAAMSEKMGNASRGIVAGTIFLSVILMILGYRSAEFVFLYEPPSWTIHFNNLLMLISVALFGAGSSKGRIRSWFRHPMLLGFTVWALAHLLVNGDLASLFLFGGLGLWAIASILIINATEGPWTRPEPGPAKGDLRLGIITLVIFSVIVFIHQLVGPWPLPGGN